MDQADMLANLAAYRTLKRFDDVQEILRAYLKHREKVPQPWMYEMLALAIERNGGSRADVKTALGYAADLAKKSKNPVDLTRVADQLHIEKLDDRAGELLSLAADLEPGNPRPLLMAINLAAQTKDAKRLAEAVTRLMALGWPGADEVWRAEARQRVEQTAKALREEGKGAEAQDLMRALEAAEPRDIFLRLSWTGDAGLDLVVTEPLGATADVLNPRTVFGGAIIKSGRGKHPESVYVCPRAFDGEYTVRVAVLYDNAKDPARDVALEIITHEGTKDEHKESRVIRLDKPTPVKFTLQGGRRKEVLPYQTPAPQQPAAAAKPAGAGSTRPATKPRPPGLPKESGKPKPIRPGS